MNAARSKKRNRTWNRVLVLLTVSTVGSAWSPEVRLSLFLDVMQLRGGDGDEGLPPEQTADGFFETNLP